MAEIEFLGTGTSTGLPIPGCQCRVCRSPDLKDKRLRTSIFWRGKDSEVLVDTGPDLRQQLLRSGIRHIDKVLITHTHADHLHGIDDLRTLSYRHPEGRITLAASDQDAREIKGRFNYIFPDTQIRGHGGGKPHLELEVIQGLRSFWINNLEVTPLPLQHGRAQVFGYLFTEDERSLGYLTDVSCIPEETRQFLLSKKLDVLIIDGLRPSPHPTHFSFSQAVEEANRLDADRVYITHLSDEVTHIEAVGLLAPNAQPAYDGLVVPI